MPKEDIKWDIYEGYLSHILAELNFPGGVKNYIPVQLMVLFLFAGGDPSLLSSEQFLKVAKAYPQAVEQTMGGRAALDTINVPEISPKDKGKFPQIWASLDDASKDKITKIFHTVQQMVGA